VVSLAIAALTIIPLAAGCRVGGAASGHPVQTATITVAAIRGVDNAPLYIAARNGTFSRAGLDVRIRTYQSVFAELQALSNGKIDIAAGDYVDFFSLVAKTNRPFLSIVADGYHAAPGVMEVLTYPGSGVTTPRSLEHRTIGTPEPQGIPISGSKPYSLETLATESVLGNDGVDPSLITWKPMAESDLIGALASHKVAAILVQEPYIFQAESTLGAVAVLDSCSGATANLPLSGYFATSSFVHKHSLALSEFRSALQRAQEGAVLPGPVRAQLATDPTMNMQSASLVTIGSYPTSLNATSLQRVADLMFTAEMPGMSHSLNVSSMIAR
jgi:NitT/TauT family transport system substrate-binding protein